MGESLKVWRISLYALLLALVLGVVPEAKAQLTIDSTPLPLAGVAQNYTTQLQASGDQSPFTWVQDPNNPGTLPPNLSLTQGGTLSGVPAQTGTFTFGVKVTSQISQATATAQMSITVVDISTPVLLPGGQVGVLYSTQFTGTAPNPTWSIVSGAVPGLSLSSAGVLSGIPSAYGTYTPMIRATFPNNTPQAPSVTADKTFSIVIAPDLPRIQTSSLADGTTGLAYSQTIQAAGGVPPYTISATAGLPPGLNVTGGVLTGTPTQAGNYSIQFRVVDSVNGVGTSTVPITIRDPLSISTATLPPAVVGTAYSQAVQAAGGLAPYTISVLSGMPPGLGFNGTQFTGAPTQAQASPYSIQFQVTDSLSGLATRTLSLMVVNPLAISTSSLAPGVTGTAYTQTVQATGGQAPYTITAVPASLPPGLGFNGTQFTGSPTTAGAYSVQFNVTDNLSFTATRTLSLTIVNPLAISTSLLAPGIIGTAYSQTVQASGGQAPYTITAVPGTLPPGVNFTGTQLTGTPTTTGIYLVQFNVTDSLNFTASRTLQLPVVDPLIISTSTLGGGTTGLAYSQTLQASGGQAPYTFTAVPASLPPGLSVSGGQLTGTPTLAGVYSVQLNVTDNLSLTATRTLSMTVRDPLSIITSGLAAGSIGIAYSQPVQAGGGFPPYTITANAATLPPGLTFNGTQLVGVPTQAGSYSLQFTVTDSQNGTASRTIGMTITGSLGFLTSSLPEGRTGIAYTQTIQAAGGLSPYTITATPSTLPPGIGFNGTQLTGTPTVVGVYPIQFQAVDANSSTASRTLTLTVRDPLAISTTTVPAGVVTVAYSQTIQATGGLGPYTITATPATLPPGISFNGTQLTGTPTIAGVYPIQFQVSDTLSGTASRTISMTINGPLTISTTSLPEGRTTVAYSQTVQAGGGVPPYTITATPATLPPGLTFNGTLLAGTPMLAGAYSVQFQVTDSQSNTASRTIPVTIRDPLAISTVTVPQATTGVAYSQTIQAAGGLGPYTITATPGTLPPGITFNGTQLVGTPSLVGIYPVPFQVTDSLNSTASRTITVAVRDPLIITTTSLPAATASIAYSQTIQVTGGLPPYTITAIPGTLPPGLAVNGADLSGTPTSVGVYPIQFQVVDAASITATRTISVTVRPALMLTVSSLRDGIVGTAYSQLLEATGGVAPYTVSANASSLPPGLTFNGSQVAGTPSTVGGYQAEFQVRDSANVSAKLMLPINIYSAASDAIRVSPLTLRFNAFQGGAQPPAQIVNVTSVNGGPIAFTATVAGDGQAQPAWLSTIFEPGSTPAQLHLRANPAGLSPGTYTASLRISAGSQVPLTIPIAFIVSQAAPKLEVAPSLIQLSSRTVNPTGQATVLLRNDGGGLDADFDARLANGSSWVRLAGAPGRLTPGQPSLLRLTLDRSGLQPGAYRDELVIQSGANQVRVPISLFVELPGSVLSASIHGLRLAGRQGDAANATQSLLIRNRGAAGTTVNWTASIVRGADVFTLTPAQGTATPGAPATLTVGLKPNATATAGAQTALLRLDDPNSQGAPEYVALVADIASSSSQPQFELAPGGLVFVGTQNAAPPAAQSISVRTGAASLNFTASTSTTDRAASNWLSAGLTSGTATATQPASLRISVNTSMLTSGIYTGLVTVASGAQVLSTPVLLILQPAPASTVSSADPKESVQPQFAVACTPSRTAISQTALNEGFAIPAGWPATLTVRLLDDCGGALPAGDVVASFSNGDAPIVLEGDGQAGVYTAAWQPGASGANTTVTISATAQTLAPAKFELKGSVQANPIQVPSLVQAGLMNSLNPIVGAPLAPGTITQIYGGNLASQPAAPNAAPLPTVYQGVEAIIGGLSAPIFAISPNQLTVQVPSELVPNQQYAALLATNTGYSLPVLLPIVPVQSGTVSLSDGGLLAQHADFTVINAASPARPGEVVSIFLVGMGATTPAIPSGTPAPRNPLAVVNSNARVTVDGQTADVLFQGLTPGGVGLYQINFRVPANARAGNLDVVISQDGVAANTTKLVVGAP